MYIEESKKNCWYTFDSEITLGHLNGGRGKIWCPSPRKFHLTCLFFFNQNLPLEFFSWNPVVSHLPIYSFLGYIFLLKISYSFFIVCHWLWIRIMNETILLLHLCPLLWWRKWSQIFLHRMISLKITDHLSEVIS